MVQERVLRSLSPQMGAARLGQAFQGRAAVRRLTAEDHAILQAACRELALEPRAALLPEEALEHELSAERPAQVAWLLHPGQGGVSPERRQKLAAAPTRSRANVRQLRALYQHRCQLCGWSSEPTFGASVAEGHHLQWLSRGGEDHIDNMVLLCPNHHRLAHARDAHLDFADLCFDFGEGQRQALLLNQHLAARVA